MANFGQCFIGLDLGQLQDYTAIAVLERAELTGEFDYVYRAFKKIVCLQLRYLERVPLRTPYPVIVQRVAEIVRAPEVKDNCKLIVDGTGVGVPVVDLLRAAGLGCTLWPVIITSADLESYENGYYRVPKRDLIMGLNVLLQRGAIQIAAGMDYGDVLVSEMTEMQVKVTPTGREQYGTWREGKHDDLVLAVAMACWGAHKVYPCEPFGDDRFWRRLLDHPNLKDAIPEKWRRK